MKQGQDIRVRDDEDESDEEVVADTGVVSGADIQVEDDEEVSSPIKDKVEDTSNFD